MNMRGFLSIAVGLAISGAPACATPVTTGGFVTINISGFFKNPVGPLASVSCSGFVSLVPVNASAQPTLATIGLSALLTSTGIQKGQATPATALNGGIQSNGTAFSCSVSVPYRWENVDLAATQMAIAYSLKGSDPGSFNSSCLSTPAGASSPLTCYVPGGSPGSKFQVIEVIPIPAAGGSQTTVTVNPKL